MADETSQNMNLEASLTQFVAGVKDVSDALRTNSEVGTLLANVLSTTMDDKTRMRVLDTATDPRLSSRDRRVVTRDLMASHISKLSRTFNDLPKLHSQVVRVTSLLQRLVTSSEAMHSGIQSLTNSIKSGKGGTDISDAVGSSVRAKTKKGSDIAARWLNKYSRSFNKYSRANPFMRTVMPGTMARARKIAGYADATRSLGYWMSKSERPFMRSIGRKLVLGGSKVGRFGASVAGGSLGAIGMLGGLAVLAAIAVMVAQRAMASYKSVLQMRGRTGDERYNLRNQVYLEAQAGTYGYSREEYAKKQMEFAKAGFTSAEDAGIIASGLRAEKYFGMDNVAQYFQTLRRSTDAIHRYGSDLGKEFFSLRTIVRNTGIGMEEFQQHQTGFMDSFKGATTKFQVGQVDALLSNFKELIASKELGGTELANFYNANQRVDTNTMLTSAWFAQQGGFRFSNPNGSLLDKAFELRHIGSGNLDRRVEAFRAELKSLYSMFGASSFKQLSGQNKFIVTEQLMPQLLGVDASKFPSIDNIMAKLESNSLTLDKATREELEKAQKVNVESIVKKMDLLENPLKHIANVILRWATGGFLSAGDYARKYVKSEDDKKQDELRQQQQIQQQNPTLNVGLYAVTDTKLVAKEGIPGQKAQLVSNLKVGGK